MNELYNKIEQANEAQIDALWSILKYREIGILRKIKSMCVVLDADFDEVIEEGVPTDESGRVIDKATRSHIHEVLIKVSQKK